MTPIIKWELQQRRTTILWWSIGIAGLVALLLLIYPSIRDQATQLNKALNLLPAGFRELKTGSSSVDISTPISYLNSQVFYATLPLFFIILAVTHGAAVVGRDELDHTLELLLARPISRGKLLLAKALSGIAELCIVAGVSTLTVVLFARIVGMHLAVSRILITGIYTLLFSLSFGAISFALTAYGRASKRASTAIAVIVGFGGYLLSSLSGLTHYLHTPAKFAPYHYFAPDKILAGQSVVGLNIYLVSIFILTMAVSYFGFRRRDIS